MSITLTWTSDADLDLFVIEPSGADARFSSCSGGFLDRDVIPDPGDNSTHSETIAWPNDSPAGNYEVTIANLSDEPTNYTLEIRIDDEPTQIINDTAPPNGNTTPTTFQN